MLSARHTFSTQETVALLNCRRLPARLNATEAAVLLGFKEHDIAVLVAGRFPVPLRSLRRTHQSISQPWRSLHERLIGSGCAQQLGRSPSIGSVRIDGPRSCTRWFLHFPPAGSRSQIP
jgi:hypothetical protein